MRGRVVDTVVPDMPTLYVLNAAAVTKPDVVQQLAADLIGYQVHIAVITETHLKKKHDHQLFVINGYTKFRRDHVGRRATVGACTVWQ